MQFISDDRPAQEGMKSVPAGILVEWMSQKGCRHTAQQNFFIKCGPYIVQVLRGSHCSCLHAFTGRLFRLLCLFQLTPMLPNINTERTSN